MRDVHTWTLWRVASTRLPTRWGMFDAIGFERDISNGTQRVETALALVMGDLTEGAPLLRCDCHDRLEVAMQDIADEGHDRNVIVPECAA